jgi:hypothetical protein
LSGHIDVLSVDVCVARAVDWKTGRKDADYSQQMRAYAALILLQDSDLELVTVTICWLRETEIERYTMSRYEAEEWLDQVQAQIVNWDGTYRPGTHCVHCPRAHDCPAAQAVQRRDIALFTRDLVGHVECDLAVMPNEQIIDLHRKARVVSEYAKRVTDAIRQHVLANGEIVAPSGERLATVIEPRRSADTARAWPVLEAAGFNDDDFVACVDISLTDAESIVAKRAGRGKGAEAVRQLRAKLDAAEAVQTKQIYKVTERRS